MDKQQKIDWITNALKADDLSEDVIDDVMAGLDYEDEDDSSESGGNE